MRDDFRVIRGVGVRCDVKADEAGHGTKVEQETDFEVCGTQIVEELPAGDGVKGWRGFDLNDDGVVYNEVESVETEFLSLEEHADRGLTDDVADRRSQLALERRCSRKP